MLSPTYMIPSFSDAHFNVSIRSGTRLKVENMEREKDEFVCSYCSLCTSDIYAKIFQSEFIECKCNMESDCKKSNMHTFTTEFFSSILERNRYTIESYVPASHLSSELSNGFIALIELETLK